MLLLPSRAALPVNRVYHSDALTLLQGLENASVDLVFIDPPYGNNNGVDDLAAARARDKVKGGRKRGQIKPIANDDKQSWSELMPLVLKDINRVLKPSGCCCCCMGGGGGKETLFARLVLWLDEYQDFFHAVVWDKSARGNGLGWRYRRNYEFVMVSHKRGGSLRWNDSRAAQPNVIYFPPTKNEHHPTEKPVKMVEWFILNHTSAGDTVLDCFAGSGTTGVAAQNLNRNYILADLDAGHVATARKRLALPHTALMFAA